MKKSRTSIKGNMLANQSKDPDGAASECSSSSSRSLSRPSSRLALTDDGKNKRSLLRKTHSLRSFNPNVEDGDSVEETAEASKELTVGFMFSGCRILTLKVLVVTIDALGHFETG